MDSDTESLVSSEDDFSFSDTESEFGGGGGKSCEMDFKNASVF